MQKTFMGYSFIFLIANLFYLSASGQVLVKPNSPNIVYQGRVTVNSDSTAIYWPGTTINLQFKGTEIKAKLKSTKEDAYFYVIIDDSVITKLAVLKKLPPQWYNLATNLGDKKHRLQLFKVSNSTSANQFFGFELNAKAKLLKPAKLPKRKIEFYGNSITVGHGVDRPATIVDSGEPKYFNNYLSYAALTARHFNAQYVCTSRSGIGVMVSWFPEIMPETYDRINPLDTASKWDFKQYQPDLIVVNLFQNDSWIVNLPDYPEFKRRFGTQKPTEQFIIESYSALIAKIRSKNPTARIICALGNMDATKEGSRWPEYVKQAVQQLNDDQVFTCFFNYKNTDGHPTASEQKAMATQLIEFIDQNIKW